MLVPKLKEEINKKLFFEFDSKMKNDFGGDIYHKMIYDIKYSLIGGVSEVTEFLRDVENDLKIRL